MCYIINMDLQMNLRPIRAKKMIDLRINFSKNQTIVNNQIRPIRAKKMIDLRINFSKNQTIVNNQNSCDFQFNHYLKPNFYHYAICQLEDLCLRN